MSFFNTSNAVTGVRNFPYYKGTIVGIMKVLAISCFFFGNSVCFLGKYLLFTVEDYSVNEVNWFDLTHLLF